LLAAVKQRASVVARLSNHLPRGEYLRQLSCGLVVGKFSHALADVARPRLEQEDNASVVWSGIQVALNNVARSITGTRRRDHIKIEDLLAQAGLESANRMVVKAIAAETWGCFHKTTSAGSSSRTRGLPQQRAHGRRRPGRSRSLCGGGDTFITHAAHLWNRSATLRQATTKAKAKKAASNFASLTPL
jgi:hypothetical protein